MQLMDCVQNIKIINKHYGVGYRFPETRVYKRQGIEQLSYLDAKED